MKQNVQPDKPVSLPAVLSDVLDEVAIGSILRHRQTGKIAVLVDYTDKYGAMVAAVAQSCGNTDDWLVLSCGSDNFDDSDGYWVLDRKPLKAATKRE